MMQGKVWISVEDDGDGIQEDLKENIFDEFVTRSDEKGTDKEESDWDWLYVKR